MSVSVWGPGEPGEGSGWARPERLRDRERGRVVDEDIMWSMILAMPTAAAAVVVMVSGPVVALVVALVRRRRARAGRR